MTCAEYLDGYKIHLKSPLVPPAALCTLILYANSIVCTAVLTITEGQAAMPKPENFQAIFKRLKTILKEYEKPLLLKANTAENYYLNTPHTEKYQKELFFGAAQIKKNYVSYHLMPVYMFPELLKDVSVMLKKRMQGKSCFNFKTIDDDLLRELTLLTKKSFERLKKEKLL